VNDNGEAPNPMLRAHVTDHSFVLTLRKTHISTLASIAHCDRTLGERQVGVADYFVQATHALQRRGLVEHRHQPPFAKSPYPHKLTDYYRLTRAGWAVFDLLVEAGFAGPIEKNSSLRKLVA
jgi:hypothetical protein